jgi:hypothetical protein
MTMRPPNSLSCSITAACAVLGLLASAGGTAIAANLQVCVPEAAGTAVVTPKASGACKPAYTKTKLLPEAEEQTLETILPYVKYVAAGVGGKPTIQISGANLQIVNGEGVTASTNGAGNLIIGYDEAPGRQSGSHSILLGNEQALTSYGGILGGSRNDLSAPFSVAFGEGNRAEGTASSVLGGSLNLTQGAFSSVSAGTENRAGGEWASVSGGQANESSGSRSAISGGKQGVAGAEGASVAGGRFNKASAPFNTISGGFENIASSLSYASVSGGYKNEASGRYSSILGGKEQVTAGEYETSP